jgi:O-antigen/teichoic acid export membrane protein
LSAAKTIAKNALFLLVMRTIGFIAAFALILRIGHVLGKEGLGIYTLATAFLQVFVLIPNFGLDTLAIRDIARERARASAYVGNVLVAKLVLAVPAFLLLLVTVLILDYPTTTRAAILLLGLGLFLDPFGDTAGSVYQGFERMELMTLVSGGSKVAVTLVSLYMLERGASVLTIVVLQVIGGALVVPMHLLFLKKVLSRLSFHASFDVIRALLREAFPLFLTTLVGLLYFRTDVIMLSKLRNESEVGLYGAAYSVLRALTMLPGVFVTAMYPALSRAYGTDRTSLKRLCDTAFKYQLAIGIPITVGIAAVSRETIDLLYGPEFAQAGAVLGVLIWSLLFFFTNTLLGYMLFSANRQREFLWVKLFNLVGNVILNALLIPRYGLFGAAIATVVTIGISFFWHLFLVSKYVYRVDFARIAIRPAIAAGLMYVAVNASRSLPLAAMIAIGAGVFAVSVLLSGFLTKDDVEIVRNIVGKRGVPPGGSA